MAVGKGSTVTVTFAGNTRDLERATDRAERKLDHFGNKANGLSSVFTKVGSVSTLAIAGIGAAMASLPVVAGLAIAALPMLFGGIGILAAAQSEKVKTAFGDMVSHVTSKVKELAKPFEPVLINIANKVGTMFDNISPELGKIFETVAPMVQTLADSIIGPGGLVEGFMKDGGLQTALDNAKPVIDAIATGFREMGPALAGFVKGLVGEDGGTGAAGGITTLFDAVNAILPKLGSFLGFMGENSDIMIPLGAVILGLAAAIKIAAAAQWIWNLAMFANPIGLVILGVLAAIAAIGLLIWKWDDLIEVGRRFAREGPGWFIGILSTALNVFAQIYSAAVWAFDGIKRALSTFASVWNATIGALPGVPNMPSIADSTTGGKLGASIPKKHGGGIVQGRIGSEVLAILQAGEKVTPIGRNENSGATMTITFAGNTDGAFATAFQLLVRSGAIQLQGA